MSTVGVYMEQRSWFIPVLNWHTCSVCALENKDVLQIYKKGKPLLGVCGIILASQWGGMASSLVFCGMNTAFWLGCEEDIWIQPCCAIIDLH